MVDVVVEEGEGDVRGEEVEVELTGVGEVTAATEVVAVASVAAMDSC